MTRRASMLDQIDPDPVASLCFNDIKNLGLSEGECITVESRRGNIQVYVKRDDGMQEGQIFVPFCYVESAANILTNAALDPDAKIPEFKFCAVKIVKNN